ncbi:MAG: glycoside hydrolase, partial [Cyclobacteriaceae bacterium]|nr:glycoside hydrolase [Cyclobacteriaceae bacterium]
MYKARILPGCSVLLTVTIILGIYSINEGHAQNVKALDLFVSGTEGVHEFRIPSMITTTSGAVLAVCDARVDKQGDVPNNIDQVLKKSLDNGNTWDKIRTIVDFPNQ